MSAPAWSATSEQLVHRHGDTWILHQACVASAPLPRSHRALILDGLEALAYGAPEWPYSHLVYNLDQGVCWFEHSDAHGTVQEYRSADRTVRLTVKERTQLESQEMTWPAPRWLEAGANDDAVRVCQLKCEGCVLGDALPFRVLHHKTTIQRRKISRPIKCALRDGLITPETTVLDYGCGSGFDVDVLTSMGIPAVGWDPVSRPDTPLEQADVVNLGYVLNIIDDPEERVRVLRHANSLAKDLLIVSAQIHNGVATQRARSVPFKDGLLTGRGTYQRFFRQRELRATISSALGTHVLCIELGVFYVTRIPFSCEKFEPLLCALAR